MMDNFRGYMPNYLMRDCVPRRPEYAHPAPGLARRPPYWPYPYSYQHGRGGLDLGNSPARINYAPRSPLWPRHRGRGPYSPYPNYKVFAPQLPMNYGLRRPSFGGLPSEFNHNESTQAQNEDPREPESGKEDGGNIWAETVSPSGVIYYYNVKTRESSWQKPENPSVQIITHDEWVKQQMQSRLSDMVSQNSMFKTSEPQPVPKPESLQIAVIAESNPCSKISAIPIPISTPALGNETNQYDQNLKQNFVTGKEREMEAFSVRSTAAGTPIQAQPMFNTNQLLGWKRNHTTAQSVHTVQPGFLSPPKSSGQVLSFSQPPPSSQGFTSPAQSAHLPPSREAIDSKLLTAAADKWIEYVDPQTSKPYYYNVKEKFSIWEKPPSLTALSQTKTTSVTPKLAGVEDWRKLREGTQQKEEIQEKRTMNSVGTKDEVGTLKSCANLKAEEKEKKSSPKRKKSKWDEKPTSSSPSTRPVSSSVVEDTCWCIVWTGDDRVFYFNTLTKSSQWSRPAELTGRVDVDELIKKNSTKFSTNQEEWKKWKKDKRHVNKDEAETSMGNLVSQNLVSSTTNNDETGLEDSKPSKQSKVETRASETITGENSDKPANSDDTSQGASVNLQEAEVARAKIPLKTRISRFQDMLIEKKVSASSVWEKELHKIIYDSRYLLLTSKERRQTFDEFVRPRAASERKSKSRKHKEIRAQFTAFLDRVVTSSKMTYTDFAKKHRSEAAYQLVERSRDRETYFAEYMRKRKSKDSKSVAEAVVKKEKCRQAFDALLREKVKDYRISWSEGKQLIENDQRFLDLDADEREDNFKFFCRCLRAETKAKEEADEARRRWREKWATEKKQPEVIILDDLQSTKSMSTSNSTPPSVLSTLVPGTPDNARDNRENANREEQESVTSYESNTGVTILFPVSSAELAIRKRAQEDSKMVGPSELNSRHKCCSDIII